MTQQSKRNKRSINGMLLLDKPTGGSSNQILQRVKYLYSAQKAGHTGALDPLASGMLPICFGETTKFAQFLLDSDKRYRVTVQLGIRTTTSDSEGEVIAKSPVAVSMSQLAMAIEQFHGDLLQIPTMFSALKHQGKPLYEYARQGITVERAARPISVYEIICHGFQNELVDLEIACSKGTYIRTLVDDLGEYLGCGAHVTALRRIQVSQYPISAMVSLPHIEALSQSGNLAALDALLLPIDSPVIELPSLALPESFVLRVRYGNKVKLPTEFTANLAPGQVRLFDEANGCFFGVGLFTESEELIPQRLVVQA